VVLRPGAWSARPAPCTPVATFTTPDLYDGAAAFTATIAWGDGHTSTGLITGSTGSFTVRGRTPTPTRSTKPST
jgi:hypothetical protein